MDQFEQLSPEEQDAVEETGAELQEYAYEAAAEDDVRVDEEFEENGVDVVQMDQESFEQWQEASQPVWESFAEEVEGGQELIDLADQVPAE
jgi:TRAP-type C4-dicarboxylate transport system substrate-binding protein